MVVPSDSYYLAQLPSKTYTNAKLMFNAPWTLF